MKRIIWLVWVLAVGSLAFSGAGCNKQASQQQPQTLEDGLMKLRASLATANADVRSNLYNGVDYGIRYGNYVNAMMALDRIAADPGLNEQQKKIVSDVMNLLKQKVQGQGAPAPARQ